MPFPQINAADRQRVRERSDREVDVNSSVLVVQRIRLGIEPVTLSVGTEPQPTFVTDQFNLGEPNPPAGITYDPVAGGESTVTITYHNAVCGDSIRIVS